MGVVETPMRFIVVGHPSRARQAHHLAVSLDAALVMDHRGEGAYANHHRALEQAARYDEHVTILEDDAIPVQGFRQKLNTWVNRYPGHVISSYLGTSHPAQWMRFVDRMWDGPEGHITLPQLIHAVCVTYPPGAAQHILDRITPSNRVDFAIGDAWHDDIIYPKASLVDHEDGTPIIQGRPPRKPRKARALAQ